MAEGFEVGLAEVAAGGLQGVEKEAGGLVVHLLGDERTHHLHEGSLKVESSRTGRTKMAGAVSTEFDVLVLEALMKEAEAVAAKSGDPH